MANTNVPSVTREMILDLIADEAYHVFPDTTLTVCCLRLKNGFAVVGASACVSPANFDARLGEEMAKEDAIREIWPLEGYRLRQTLADAESAPTSQEALYK